MFGNVRKLNHHGQFGLLLILAYYSRFVNYRISLILKTFYPRSNNREPLEMNNKVVQAELANAPKPLQQKEKQQLSLMLILLDSECGTMSERRLSRSR